MRHVLLPYAIAALVVSSSASGAVIFSDGFTAAGFAANYSVASYGSPFAVSATDGTASIRKLPTPGGAMGVTYIIPKIEVVGDFRQDVTVDFADVANPGASVTIVGGLSVNFGDGAANSDQLGAFIDREGIGRLSYNFLSEDADTQSGIKGILHITDMRLRIERRGQTVSTFVGYGTDQYQLLDAITGGGFTAPASFYLSLNAYLPTVSAATVRFSNFSISTVPEPSQWSMLMVGFGLAGAFSRSRRRDSGPSNYCVSKQAA